MILRFKEWIKNNYGFAEGGQVPKKKVNNNVIKNHLITNNSNDNRLQIFIDSKQVASIDPQITYACTTMEHEQVTVEFANKIEKGELYELREIRVLEIKD